MDNETARGKKMGYSRGAGSIDRGNSINGESSRR